MAFAIGQFEPPEEQARLQRTLHNRGWDRIEPELRPPEEREVGGVVDGAPGEIDEPAAGRALDVPSCEVDTGLRSCGGAVQAPGGRRTVAGNETEEFVPSAPALHTAVGVVVPTGRVAAGAAGAPPEVGGP